MHKFSQNLALRITGSKNMDDTSEMVSYSLEAIFTSTLTALTAFCLTLWLNCHYEFIVFNLCFIPIRLRHKSFHFKKFLQCFLCSNVMIVLCSLILKHYSYQLIMTPFVFIVLFVLYYLSIEKDYIEFILIAIFLTLSLFINQIFSLSILLSLIVNTILIIRRNYDEKNNKHD